MSDAAPTKRIKVGCVDQLPNILSLPKQSCQWIVDKFIARETLTLLTGVSGSGKTFVALDLARAVSTGESFGGLKTTPLPVLILDRESPLWIAQERLEQMKIDPDAAVHDLRHWGSWINPRAPGARDEVLLNYVRLTRPKPMLIFDTLVSFFDEGSENDSNDVRGHMDGYRALVDMGCTVVCLMHVSEKAGGFYRGSSDFPSSADIAFKLEKIGKEQHLTRAKLTNFKARFPVAETLQLSFDGTRFQGATQLNSQMESKLVSLLEQNPGVQLTGWDQLTKEANIPRGAARNWLEAGIESGSIERTKGLKNASAYKWVGPRLGFFRNVATGRKGKRNTEWNA